MFHGWFQCPPFVDDSSQDIPGHPGPILPTADPRQEKVSISSPTPHATGALGKCWKMDGSEPGCVMHTCTLYTMTNSIYIVIYIYIVSFMDLMHISCRGI